MLSALATKPHELISLVGDYQFKIALLYREVLRNLIGIFTASDRFFRLGKEFKAFISRAFFDLSRVRQRRSRENLTPSARGLWRRTMRVSITMKTLFAFLFMAQCAVAEDSKRFSWGITQEEVKSKEIAELIHESEDTLTYRKRSFNTRMNVSYQFFKGKLMVCTYSNSESHQDKNVYIKDFIKIRSLLTKKYGEPKESFVRFNHPHLKGNLGYYGLYISTGDLVYHAEWESEESLIRTDLTGDDFKIYHQVVCESKDNKKERDGQAISKTIEKL